MRGDLGRRFVGNNADALVRLQPETDADGIARAGGQLGFNCVGEESIRHKVLKLPVNARRATLLHLKNEPATVSYTPLTNQSNAIIMPRRRERAVLFHLQISQIEFLPVSLPADYSLSGHEVTSIW